MDVAGSIEKTVTGLGYEFVDFERAGRGLLRVFIDKAGGIGVEDCAAVSNQLTRVFAVEGIDYDRLEVSSPGLDRPLKREADFERFAGRDVKLRLRVPRAGQRNFVGRIVSIADGKLVLDVDGTAIEVEVAGIDRANLVPEI
ncbi:MAG: ribosome maturation factor RimP [Betaproteobacteria bacterium]|nr:ribosome maturation factor RimP [Betaproteobacteria bacterium]MDE2132166.1 ribosome maturation factor RimP [Betaproteobacteria bacterium]MDE2211630.1 ribosome maturation factor RimP [Betaproteobacteria bacterium]MDE2354175.1 ribosome maturation factor RimP [Betaproteobacteria bacterium]MDE2624982.1 ribosome maturation factor RimP [Betaproteobacteria bacterium]